MPLVGDIGAERLARCGEIFLTGLLSEVPTSATDSIDACMAARETDNRCLVGVVDEVLFAYDDRFVHESRRERRYSPHSSSICKAHTADISTAAALTSSGAVSGTLHMIITASPQNLITSPAFSSTMPNSLVKYSLPKVRKKKNVIKNKLGDGELKHVHN